VHIYNEEFSLVRVDGDLKSQVTADTLFYSRRNLTVCIKATAPQKQNNRIHLVVEIVFGFIETRDVPLTIRQLHKFLDKTKLQVLRELRPPPNASDNPVNPDFGLRTPGSGR